MRIPTELIPRCPHCGKPLTMNLRSDSEFVQDESWYTAAKRHEDFPGSHQTAVYCVWNLEWATIRPELSGFFSER